MAELDGADATTLQAIASGLQAVLSDALVGAYLHGSTGRGRLQPRSDLDVLLVTNAPLTDDQRRRLTSLLWAVSGRASGGTPRPVELTSVVQADVRPWRYPPRCDYQYGEWLRAEVEAGEPLGPFVSPDLSILVAMVLSCRRPLLGPPPEQVLDPVPGEDVVRAAADGVPGLLDDLASDTANVLLTLARAWRTCATGDVVAKDVAAEWAQQRLPAELVPPLAHARNVDLGSEPDDWAGVDGVRSTAGYLSGRIAESASEPAQ